MTLELKIGNIELSEVNRLGANAWKFIVSIGENKETLLFYAGVVPHNLGDGGKFYHSQVAAKNKVRAEDILGGGYINYFKSGNLKLDNLSGDFGCVPNKIVEAFLPLVLPTFKSKYDIKSTEVKMHIPDDPESIDLENKKWNRFGYNF